jgi:hypothetical protein
MPTTRRLKSRRRPYRGEHHYYDLLWGPCDDCPGPTPTVETLRDVWEHGGREYVMRWAETWRPGFRPWAWWEFDFPDEYKRAAERKGIASPDRFPMEILEAFGFAREGERAAYDRAQAERAEFDRRAERNDARARA